MVTEQDRAAGGCTHPGTPPKANRVQSRQWEQLIRHFTPRKAAYIASALTPAELAVVADVSDALVIARIKRMKDARLERFDRLAPADPTAWRLYRSLQLRWLRDEEYLLGTRLGRSPSPRELSCDFENHRNGLRFRAFFALKFPDKMKPRPCRQGSPGFGTPVV